MKTLFINLYLSKKGTLPAEKVIMVKRVGEVKTATKTVRKLSWQLKKMKIMKKKIKMV
jgi:hypothetical protein